MTSEARRIPDALLERYLADALPLEAKAHLEATLANSTGDQARLAELRADSAAFLLRRPPSVIVKRFEDAQRRTPRWRWSTLLIPVLAAAAVILMLLRPTEGPYTVKGPPVVVLHRKTANGSVEVSPDVPLAPGDDIRFEVKASASGFLAVLSRDAKGTITVYYPYGGEAAAPYDAHQPLLPGAISLDDTLGREDVYALHSTRAFNLAWALEALQAGRPLEEVAPRSISVGHTFFMKQAAPPQNPQK